VKVRIKGAHSRRAISSGDLDRRTYEGKLFHRFRRDLLDHLGRKPTATEAALIERTCWVHLRCSLLDAKLASGELTQIDSAQYLAWANTERRSLVALGLGKAVPAPSLAAFMAEISRDDAA
jgi:hypothetical protein